MINGIDFIGVTSRDAERTRAFYLDTLGPRRDDHAKFEFWAGGTCFGIWEPDGNDLMLHHRYAPRDA